MDTFLVLIKSLFIISVS